MDALCLRRVVAAARKGGADIIVFDRYIYDQLAILPFEHPVARICIRFILGLVPAPDVAYLLDADPDAAIKRKPEYPVDFLRRYRLTYLRLQRAVGLALIPPLTVDEVHEAIMQKFESVSGLRIAGPSFGLMVSAW